MGLSFFVDVESVSVKKPKLLRFFVKELRVCCLLKCHLSFFEVRVCVPKTFRTSKGRET